MTASGVAEDEKLVEFFDVDFQRPRIFHDFDVVIELMERALFHTIIGT